MKFKSPIITILFINISTIIFGQQKVFENDDIKVNLPKIDIDSSFKTLDNFNVRLIQADDNYLRYSITNTENSEDFGDLDTFYKNGTAKALQKMNAKVSFEKDTIINDFKAKILKYSYINEGEEQICNSLIISIKNNIYIIQTIYFKNLELEAEFSKKTKEFFSSVNLKKHYETPSPIGEKALTIAIFLAILLSILIYFKSKKKSKLK